MRGRAETEAGALARAVVPIGFGDLGVILVARRVKGTGRSDGPAAANVEEGHGNGRVVVGPCGTGKGALALAVDGLDLGAGVMPGSVLNPKAGAVTVLLVDAIDGHGVTPMAEGGYRRPRGNKDVATRTKAALLRPS